MPGLPGWESGCGSADPALSHSFDVYTGTGYAPKPQGIVGTIGVGNPFSVGLGPDPAQIRMFISGSSLIFLENQTGNAYSAAPLAMQPPAPAYYNPTK